MRHDPSSVLAVAAILAGNCGPVCATPPGLTLKIFDNTGRSPSAGTTTHYISTPHFNFSTAKPFSAEISGTINFVSRRFATYHAPSAVASIPASSSQQPQQPASQRIALTPLLLVRLLLLAAPV